MKVNYLEVLTKKLKTNEVYFIDKDGDVLGTINLTDNKLMLTLASNGAEIVLNEPQGFGATGQNHGDYLYWNTNINPANWVVDGNKIHIGTNAGKYNQGDYAIAIGAYAGVSGQPPNSIIINASGEEFPTNMTNALYINPVRQELPLGVSGSYESGLTSMQSKNVLSYKDTTKEITYRNLGLYNDITPDSQSNIVSENSIIPNINAADGVGLSLGSTGAYWKSIYVKEVFTSNNTTLNNKIAELQTINDNWQSKFDAIDDYIDKLMQTYHIVNKDTGEIYTYNNPNSPPRFSYTSPQIYYLNMAITKIIPISTGGPTTSWSISPALPTGLSFNTSSGVITGTPTVVVGATTYTVTGVNGAGSATADIVIIIGQNAPPIISYSSPQTYNKYTPITSLIPYSGGGAVTIWSVSPALPTGLSLNTNTGVISGTPRDSAAQDTYVVTATNVGGSATASIVITVGEIPAPNISYSSPQTYTKDTAISALSPNNAGGAVIIWSVSPDLPAGLTLDTGTGVISGTPIAVTETTTYTVTGINGGGISTAAVVITVAAPTALNLNGYISFSKIFKNLVAGAFDATGNINFDTFPTLPDYNNNLFKVVYNKDGWGSADAPLSDFTTVVSNLKFFNGNNGQTYDLVTAISNKFNVGNLRIPNSPQLNTTQTLQPHTYGALVYVTPDGYLRMTTNFLISDN